MKAKPSKKLSRCPNCGHAPLREDTITDRFEYRPDDVEPLMVEARDVPVEICPSCGEKFLGPAAARVQHAAICRAVGLLTPEEIKRIRERFGPSQEEFAALTGIGVATISRWERGRMLQNEAMDRYLRLLAAHPENANALRQLRAPAEPVSLPESALAHGSRGAVSALGFRFVHPDERQLKMNKEWRPRRCVA
ncbi:MAG: type II toxin-antitoxin system MqsA family antitoxin [Gemmataceae bacterium]|nr:type II toxin-antitoxin system MqsA family antitoxin [Gemmataceae bacterium]